MVGLTAFFVCSIGRAPSCVVADATRCSRRRPPTHGMAQARHAPCTRRIGTLKEEEIRRGALFPQVEGNQGGEVCCCWTHLTLSSNPNQKSFQRQTDRPIDRTMRALLLLFAFFTGAFATATPCLRRDTQELREYAAARGFIAQEVANPRTLSRLAGWLSSGSLDACLTVYTLSLQTPSPATATSSRRTTTRCTRIRLVSMDICDRGICSGHLIQHNSTHTTTAHMGGTADALLNPQGIAGMGPGAVTLGIKSQDEGRE